MKKHIKMAGYIFILILLSLNIFLGIKNINFKKNISLYQKQSVLKEIGFQEESKKVKKIIMDDFERVIKSEIKIASIPLINSNDIEVDISEIVIKKGVFVFYFKEKGCGTCFEREVLNIKKNHELYQNKNIIVISDFETLEQQKAFELNYRVKSYDINSNRIGLFIEKYKEPFYFRIDTNYKVSNIYRPTNFLDERSKVYFNFINSSTDKG